LKILNISGYDTVGALANGYFLHKEYLKRGHESSMAVYTRRSLDKEVRRISGPVFRWINERAAWLEERLSLHSMIVPGALPLYFTSMYRNADIIHIHLPHVARFFSILNLPVMSRNPARPVVLSFHDMFMMTGACHYSLDCENWLTGCRSCPDICRTYILTKDRMEFMWKVKKWAMDRSSLAIVVGSDWQLDLARRSPILSRFPCVKIPYALDTSIFHPMDQEFCRLRLGIPRDADVISFRSVPYRKNFKGHDYIVRALREYQPKRETYLLTFEAVGGLEEFDGKYRIVDVGWTLNQRLVAMALAASDIFLMPSIAEGFGLMAIESMAVETPVIVFEGTALPETVRAPKGGLAIPQDHMALADAVKTLLGNDELRKTMGRFGADTVRRENNEALYTQRYLELYESLLEKAGRKNPAERIQD